MEAEQGQFDKAVYALEVILSRISHSEASNGNNIAAAFVCDEGAVQELVEEVGVGQRGGVYDLVLGKTAIGTAYVSKVTQTASSADGTTKATFSIVWSEGQGRHAVKAFTHVGEGNVLEFWKHQGELFVDLTAKA